MKTTSKQPSAAQRAILESLAEGGIIAVVHTRGGTIASLFPREGRHRNISYKVVMPMLEEEWIADVVPEPLRWRGSKYEISQKGRQALASAEQNGKEVHSYHPAAPEPVR